VRQAGKMKSLFHFPSVKIWSVSNFSKVLSSWNVNKFMFALNVEMERISVEMERISIETFPYFPVFIVIPTGLLQ